MNTPNRIKVIMLSVAAATFLATATGASASELWALPYAARLDGDTGEYLGLFVDGGPPMSGFGMTVGPDGNLYVAGIASPSHEALVARFDTQTHQYIDTFVAPGSGGLDEATDLTFGPDGNLYVASAYTSTVLRYDGQTGAFLNVFASEGVGYPEDMRFGPDGNLYVASLDNDGIVPLRRRVWRLDRRLRHRREPVPAHRTRLRPRRQSVRSVRRAARECHALRRHDGRVVGVPRGTRKPEACCCRAPWSSARTAICISARIRASSDATTGSRVHSSTCSPDLDTLYTASDLLFIPAARLARAPARRGGRRPTPTAIAAADTPS